MLNIRDVGAVKTRPVPQHLLRKTFLAAATINCIAEHQEQQLPFRHGGNESILAAAGRELRIK